MTPTVAKLCDEMLAMTAAHLGVSVSDVIRLLLEAAIIGAERLDPTSNRVALSELCVDLYYTLNHGRPRQRSQQ